MQMWTSEQRQAIEKRGSNLLVAAGAGAGKTAVLVERIVSRLTDPLEPLDIDNLLVVTFTNAAATEMRSRIGEALARLAEQNPLEPRLRRQQLLLNKASISTLHSFCLDILRQHFYRLELDPAFKIADDIEAALIRADVLEKVFEGHYETLSENFALLVEGFGGKHDDAGLGRLVLNLADYSRSQADPVSWLSGLSRSYDCGDDGENYTGQAWYAELRQAISDRLQSAISSLSMADTYAALPDGPLAYGATLDGEKRALVSIQQALPSLAWDELRRKVAEVEFSRLPPARGGSPALKERATHYRDRSKKIIKKDLVEGLLAQTAAEVRGSLQVARSMVTEICTLVAEFQALYQQAKQVKNLVDFSDLEHMALAILSAEGSPVQADLRARFKEILVDEYQDINGVQERILSLVSSGANLVMVGDVKQSIYRFRLAEPRLFLEKYADYAGDSQLGQRVHLASNFRSRPHIILAVNYIFGQLMSPAIGEIAYDQAAALIPAANYPPPSEDPAVELLLLDTSESDPEEEEGENDLDTPSKEARAIGKKILDMVQGGKCQVWDKARGAMRDLAFRDIVVLLRATKGWGEVFAEVFRQLSLPAYVDVGTGYFATTEISVMLSLLKVVDNPEQDIPLAAVLRSPCVGLSGDELTAIRLAAPEETFAAAVRQSSQSGDALGEKLSRFLAQLASWRKLAMRGSLPELIWRLYRDTGYFNYVGALPSGTQRQANLRALYERACQYEATSFKGLFRFLRFIERLQEEEKDMGQAPALSESEDVVRVMSIHKSKGLEFPVVIVAGLGRKFNMTDFAAPMLIHRSLGLGMRVVDLDTRCKYPTIVYHALKHRLQQELLSEEMRILYVALTRAKEKLILAGSVAKLQEKMAAWRSQADDLQLPVWQVAEGRNFLDWIGPACLSRPPDSVRFSICGREADSSPTESFISYQEELRAVKQGLPWPPQGFADQVSHRLAWVYAHATSTITPIKSSVSELKRRFAPPDDLTLSPPWWKRPRSLPRDSGLAPAEVGSALHMFMQHVDLGRSVTQENLEQQLSTMLGKKLLTPLEARSVDLGLVLGFFGSKVGERLLAAEKVWREVPFGLRLDATKIHPGVEGESIYIQGVIDCLFLSGGSLVLVDFKSDRVSEETTGLVVDRYRGQVGIYAQAIEEILGRRVAERYLYFFALGTAVSLGS